MSGKLALTTIAAACALCLALVGCGGGSASSSAAGSAAASSATSSSAASSAEPSSAAASGAAASSAASADTASSAASNSAASSSAEARSASTDSDLSKALVGKWTTYSATYGDETKTVDEADDEAKELSEKQYFVFRDDGTCSMVDENQDFEQKMNWALDGESIELTYEGQSLSEVGYTVTFDGAEIAMSVESPDGSDKYSLIMRKAA